MLFLFSMVIQRYLIWNRSKYKRKKKKIQRVNQLLRKHSCSGKKVKLHCRIRNQFRKKKLKNKTMEKMVKSSRKIRKLNRKVKVCMLVS